MEINVKDRNGQEFTYTNKMKRQITHIIIASYPDTGRKIVSGSIKKISAVQTAANEIIHNEATDVDIVEVATGNVSAVALTVN